MKKTGRAETVAPLKGAIAAQRGAVVASYRGMTVAEMTALRKQLREGNAEFKVVKNTMNRLAAQGTPFQQLTEHFKGCITPYRTKNRFLGFVMAQKF